MIRNFEPFTIGDINSDDWQNPKKTGKNTVAPHSYFVPFEMRKKRSKTIVLIPNTEYRLTASGLFLIMILTAKCRLIFIRRF